MLYARAFIAADNRRDLLQLNRFPDREARENQYDAAQDDREVGGALRGVEYGQVLVRQLSAQRLQHVVEYRPRRDRQELPPEVFVYVTYGVVSGHFRRKLLPI